MPAIHASPTSAPRRQGALENAWIEIFRAGDYGERGRWGEAELDLIAAAYNPRLHPAPVVIGHPGDDAPAFAWIKALRRTGASLWAQLQQVDPAFEALLRQGRFRTRSVALYTHFPATRGPYLRHVGFLGAQPPEVKGLAPVRFFAADCVAFNETVGSLELPPEEAVPETKSKLEAFLDHLRAFFSAADKSQPIPELGSPLTDQPVASFAERITQLEQRLDQLAEAKRAAEQKLAEAASAERHQQIAAFIETLRARGKFPPVFERLGVRAFLERLAEIDATVPGEENSSYPAPAMSEVEGARTPGEDSPPVRSRGPLLAWFQNFLNRLPTVIDFRELTADTGQRLPGTGPEASGKLVRFTEPQRGVAIDPASVELAERAQALAAELGISYAAALARVREEHRAAHPCA